MSQGPQDPPSRRTDPERLEIASTLDAAAHGAEPRSARGDRALPAAIGGYRIIGILGQGGMGIVYEAEQDNPRRRVALKVIRGGTFVDESRVRMFQREAATLARLVHPNIGAIYEAGRTEAGEHFFAMELVRGQDLDDYLRARSRPLDRDEIRFRLRLMASICGAVHYAHQRGVIHRDLKPNNIIVAESGESSTRGVPEVKVLDFGLARITESDVEATTAVTEIGVIMGTLPYMSPEQASGHADQIDVRTDVYALGVILYEMLTGRRPYDVQRTSIVEAVRVICEQPPTPLTRSWTGTRAPDADLQTILGKALEKEADRRYGSAEALAEDLQRHLDSRPILARAPSTMYQLRKFAQRNRALVGGVVATMLALVAGIIATTSFGLREAAQRRAAEEARKETQTVAEFQAAMLSGIDAARMGRRLVDDLASRLAEARRAAHMPEHEVATSVAAFRAGLGEINSTDAALRVIDVDILARALAAADSQFAAQPRIRAQLERSIGETYFRLGLYEKSEPPLVAARALYDSVAGRDAAPTLEAARVLAGVYEAEGRTELAEPLYLSALAAQQRTLGALHPDAIATMNDLGVLYTDNHRFAAAESLFAIALPAQTRLKGESDRFTLTVAYNYAWALSEDDKFPKAESLMVRVLAIRRRLFGNDDPETMQSVNNLGVLYRRTGRNELAEPLYVEDYETTRRLLGDDHPEMLVSMTNLGRLYNDEHKYAAAESILAIDVIKTRKQMGTRFIGTGITTLEHGKALVGLGRDRDAEPELLEAHRILHAIRGDDDPGVRHAADVLAALYQRTGRAAMAKAWRLKGTGKS